MPEHLRPDGKLHLNRLDSQDPVISAASAWSSTPSTAPSHVMSSLLQTTLSPSAPSQWTADSLVENNNFKYVPRISSSQSLCFLLDKVREHESTGVPLIIEGWHQRPNWNDALFSMEGFIGDGTQIVDVRDTRTSMDVKMPLSELAHHYEAMMKRDPQKVLGAPSYYGKDIPCPEKWEEWLTSNIPTHFHPRGANDLISCLPPKDRAETLMCYMGIGDTYTPAHKDPCGSFGHNLMCHTTGEGSAFWFMSASGPLQKDEPAAYFHDKLGVELDLESHKASVEEFRAAPFDVYVAEQRLGDLVLVPPRSCHQVVNKGGITIKMSWSRMGIESLQYSLCAELTVYHRVCRPETYRVKHTVLAAVKEYTQRLIDMDPSASSCAASSVSTDSCLPFSSSCGYPPSTHAKAITPSSVALTDATAILARLTSFLKRILIEEWSPDHQKLKHLPADKVHELHMCDFCGADIFQSFFACAECSTGDDGTEFICCPTCYIEGRSCSCGAGSMDPHQSWPFDNLLLSLNSAVNALNKYQAPGNQMSPIDGDTMDSSSHLRTFYAACILRSKMQTTDNRNAGRQCTKCIEYGLSQYTGPSFHVHCRVCNSHMCVTHILDVHNVHIAEALLASARDEDHTTWHAIHTSRSRHCQILSSKPQGLERGEVRTLAEQMAWAAATFKMCRPIDLTLRAKRGFYDKFEFMGPGVIQAAMPSSQKSILYKKHTVMNNTPLTDLSELPPEDMVYMYQSEQSEDDSDDDFSPVRRKMPKTRIPAVVIEPIRCPPRTPTVEPVVVSMIPGIRPNPQSRPYVLVPFRGKKRAIIIDSYDPSKPEKRQKCTKYGPPTQRPRKPREILSQTLKCTPAAKDSVTYDVPRPTVPPARSKTLVPVGSSLLPRSKSSHSQRPRFIPAREVGASRRGKPPYFAQHEVDTSPGVALRPGSSASNPVPTSSDPSTQTVEASISNSASDEIDIVMTLLNRLQQEQAKSEEFQKLLEQSQLSECTLRMQIAGLKADNTERRGFEMRAEISKLKEELAEVREVNKTLQWREQEHLEERDGVRREHGRLMSMLDDYKRQITILREKLEESEANLAGNERFIHLTGPMIGSALTQNTASSSNNTHFQRGTLVVATGNRLFHQSPRGPKGPDWHTRMRPLGRHPFGLSHAQYNTKTCLSGNDAHEHGRNTFSTQFPSRNNDPSRQAIGRAYVSDRNSRRGDRRIGPSSRNIIYERVEGFAVERRHELDQQHPERHGTVSERRERRHEGYRNRSATSWKVEDRYRSGSKQEDESQRRTYVDKRCQGAQRELSNSDEASREQRETDVHSRQSCPSVSSWPPHGSGDIGWQSSRPEAADHHYDRRRQSDVTSPRDIHYAHSPPLQQRDEDDSHHDGPRYGCPNIGFPPDQRNDHGGMEYQTAIEYHDEEIMEPDPARHDEEVTEPESARHGDEGNK